MSFFSRSRRQKSSSSRDTKSQTSAHNVKNASGEPAGSTDIGTSLFSGMTLTASSASTASREGLSLMGHSDITPTKQSGAAETATAITQDFPTVLAKSEPELLPEPILPTPVNVPQQVSQSTAKKKRTRQTIRPGYARQPDTKDGEPSRQGHDVAVEKSCDTAEQGKVIKQDAAISDNSTQPEVSIPVPQTPLYSIGTPSSSEENLFLEVEASPDTGSLIAVSSEGTSKDHFSSDVRTQGNSDKELICIMDASRDKKYDKDFEMTRLDRNVEVPVLQELGGIVDSPQLDEFLDELQNPPVSQNVMLDDYSCLTSCAAQESDLEREMANLQAELESNEEADQNLEQELPQLTVDLGSSSSMESHHLDVSEKPVSQLSESNYSINLSSMDKLIIALQCMKSQLATLSKGKTSLRSLEEELFKLYKETEHAEYEKEQQVKALQLEESEALANDNYDLAEEISYRMEQLKVDLESSRYRLPAQDHKVEKALKLRVEIAEKEAEIYRDSQAKLEQVREEQQECLTSHVETSTAWSVREKQRLNADRQRLERVKDHLRLDKEHMETENEELSKEILQQTEEFQTKKEELVQERGLLQEEISALEAKLAKLKEKEEKFTEAIKQEESKIESVKMTFSPQQNALDKQQQEIEAREKSLQEEFELLLSTQKQFDEKTEEHCAKEKELTEVISTASDELNKSAEVIKGLEEQQKLVQDFLNMEHFTFDTDSKLADLHAKQEELSQQIKILSNKIQLEQRGVVTLRKSLNEIEAQISDLDVAKERAKQERNFKEAKRLKEERETLTQEGVESQGKLESLLQEIAEDKKLLEEVEQESNDLDSEISEQDRAAAIVTVEKAPLVIQALRGQINRIGDDNLVKTLLETEAKTCQNLISDLCKKHSTSAPDVDYHQAGIQRNSQEAAAEQEKVSKCEGFEEKANKCAELLDKLDELEGRLEAVVEVEDFDEADRLQQEITKLKETIEKSEEESVT